MTPDPDVVQTLSVVSTATITTILLKKGLRNVWLRGCSPLRSGAPRIVGPAFTLRFIPMREDLATPESWSSPRSCCSRSTGCSSAGGPVARCRSGPAD